MWGYPSSPDDELKALERYRRILEIRSKLLENEIRFLNEKIRLLKELVNEYAQTGSITPPPSPVPSFYEWGYNPPYPTPSYQPTPYIQKATIKSTGKYRIVIASQGPNGLDDIVSPVFARAPFFILRDVENGEIKNVETVENRFGMMGGGAGMAAAQYMRELNANIVIAGSFGPNSQGMLQSMGIRTMTVPPTPIKEALKRVGL